MLVSGLNNGPKLSADELLEVQSIDTDNKLKLPPTPLLLFSALAAHRSCQSGR